MKNIAPMMCLLMLICACSKNEHPSVEQQPGTILCGETTVLNSKTGQYYQTPVYCSANQVQQQPASHNSPEKILCGETPVFNAVTGQAYNRPVYCN
jgi:hypothetical protein